MCRRQLTESVSIKSLYIGDVSAMHRRLESYMETRLKSLGNFSILNILMCTNDP